MSFGLGANVGVYTRIEVAMLRMILCARLSLFFVINLEHGRLNETERFVLKKAIRSIETKAGKVAFTINWLVYCLRKLIVGGVSGAIDY